jgi:hypothetical protein
LSCYGEQKGVIQGEGKGIVHSASGLVKEWKRFKEVNEVEEEGWKAIRSLETSEWKRAAGRPRNESAKTATPGALRSGMMIVSRRRENNILQ